MATIKQYGGQGMAMRFASIILENDAEVDTLPIHKEDPTKTPLHNHTMLSVGSEAFCPSTLATCLCSQKLVGLKSKG